MMGLSYILGERHKDLTTDEPYESGVRPFESARLRFSVKYYLVALFFVIFDVEAVFLFAWAVSVRETGWPGYAAVSVFILLLFAALAYVWKTGALDWGRRARGA